MYRRPAAVAPVIPARAVPNRKSVPTSTRVLTIQPNTLPIPVRYKAIIMRRPIGRLPPTTEKAITTKQNQKEPFELLAKYDVDNEVDAGIDGNQEVAGVDDLVDDG